MRNVCVGVFCLSGLTLASSVVVGQTKPRQATLAQQKICADQARKTFDKDYGGQNADFTSHYDPKANVCYIMVHTYPKAGEMMWSELVFDAFEGRAYAHIVYDSSSGKAPLDCYVKLLGSEKAFCHSPDEFETLVDKHFGMGR